MPCSHQKYPEGHPDFFTRLRKTCSAEQASENLFHRTSWYQEISGTWICTFNWRTPQAAMLGPRQSQGWIHQASHLHTLTILNTKCYLSEWTTKTQSCEHGNDTATVYDYNSLPAELHSNKLCWAISHIDLAHLARWLGPLLHKLFKLVFESRKEPWMPSQIACNLSGYNTIITEVYHCIIIIMNYNITLHKQLTLLRNSRSSPNMFEVRLLYVVIDIRWKDRECFCMEPVCHSQSSRAVSSCHLFTHSMSYTTLRVHSAPCMSYHQTEYAKGC